MIWFPQTSQGAVAQLPFVRSRSWRTVVNELENGEAVVLPDPTAGEVTWQLTYQDLSDVEARAISGLFAQMNGRAGSFGFIDPMSNLLAWSEDFARPDWQAGQLQTAPGAEDPLGTTRAWSVTNNAAAPQSVGQTLGLPSGYTTCLSLWAKCNVPCNIVLSRGSIQSTVGLGTAWKRVWAAWEGNAGADESTFGIVLAAGQQVTVFGPQIEAQPNPSLYKPTTAARGIYQETRFAGDDLNIAATGVGRSNCRVTLISRV